MNKSLLVRSLAIGFIAGIALYGLAAPQIINADLNNSTLEPSQLTIMKDGHLTICKLDKTSFEVVKKVKMMVTAYSSTEDQTDDTPFITASGKHVEDGIIANNMLPFGTKVRIPKLYGDKIFVVEDRMHARKGKYQADIWFSNFEKAKNFGAVITDIEVVES